MRSILLLAILAISLSSCYSWKRGFVRGEPNEEKTYTYDKNFKINPKDFFYLKQAEYFEVYNNVSDSSEEPYANEASVRLYKSVPVNYAVKSNEKIVEEKYMYLHNLSDTTVKNGEVFYFRTATYWGEGKDRSGKRKLGMEQLQKHFTNKDTIDLSTSKELQVGYWSREGNKMQLLLNDGSNSYRVEATMYKDSLVFKKISHPNKDVSSKNIDEELMITLSEVMNVQSRQGLTYYRNIDPASKEVERKIVVSEYGISPKQVLHLRLQYNGSGLKLETGTCFLEVLCGSYRERWGYHKTLVIPEEAETIFLNKKQVPKEEDLEELRKNARK